MLVVVLAQTTVEAWNRGKCFFCFFNSLELSVITVKQGIRETQQGASLTACPYFDLNKTNEIVNIGDKNI